VTLSVDHPLENSCFAAATNGLPTATPRESPLKQRVAGGMVNSRTGKTDVNPLTRPSSRSVMRGNYSSLHVEGLAATIGSLLNRIVGQRAHSDRHLQ
jgi:hypothetical protein